MIPFILINFCSMLLLLCRTVAVYTHDPDTYRSVNELITTKGYPLEEYTVQTVDGYLLSLLRIPHGRNDLQTNTNGPVLLVHGIFGDAGNWVLNFPGQSLGFILPDAGYDTWLVNTRGNIYSKNHVAYTTHQYAFWNFSFEEVGQYDIPATIDYILDATEKKNLYLIAHSQGNSASFAMLSDLPDYNEKVKLYVALAPVVFLGHIRVPIRPLVPIRNEIALIINSFTAGEILSDNELNRPKRVNFCRFAQPLCETALFVFAGKDRTQLNESRFEVYIGHYPSGSSTKSLVHYAQLVESGKYRKYDYEHKNMEHYSQAYPPDFELFSITTPVAMFWSSNDKFVDPKDVDILRGQLNSLVFDYHVPYLYEHFDYLAAINANELVYKPILRLLLEY